MLEIKKEKNGSQFTATLAGRIDSTTSSELEDALAGEFEGITKVVFDMAKITYISSAGLRVILGARKAVGEDGQLTILNANEEVREIFEVTNLDNIIDIA